jgi:hypothetical protein
MEECWMKMPLLLPQVLLLQTDAHPAQTQQMLLLPGGLQMLIATLLL